MIENWIDALCDRWAIATHTGGTVRSYRMFGINEFPESLELPCAITYPVDVRLEYSTGGPIIEHWRGRTEFHLFPGADKRHYPELIQYFRRIRNAAMGAITLSGKVAYMLIDSAEGEPSMQGPVVLQYGDGDAPHLGIVVNWRVKSNISTESGLTVAA